MLKKVLDTKYCLIFLFLGLTVFFYKSAISGFDLLPGDNIDSRYINYILEHLWLWLHQTPPHNELWNMPALYPVKNYLAFSDVLFGLGIFYVPLRFITNPYNSFLITVFVMCVFNFITFYFLLKKCFCFKDLSSAVGAYFYAFSVIKYAQLYHVQLLSQFYTILAFICFIKSKNHKYLFFAGSFFVALQFYTSFYMGWFIIFSIFILAVILPFYKIELLIVFEYFKKNYKLILSNLLFVALILSPLALHYLMVGTTKYSYEVVKYLQTPFKNYFINLSFIDNLLLFKFENLNIDYVYGFGILTSVLLLFCVLNLKKYRGIAVFFIILIYATANIDFLQKLIYDYFPAGGAIRVIGRYVNILCPVFAIILANFIENFNKNSIKTAIIVLLIIEQLPAMSLFSYSKKEAFRDITKYNVPKTCNVIFLNYLEKKW